MSLKYFVLLTVIAVLLNQSLQVTNFSYILGASERICLHEYFSDKTLVVYEVFSEQAETQFTINDPDGKALFDKKNTKMFKESFTTFSGGYYEICIQNHNGSEQSKIDFDMKHGVAAKDYSSVAKTKDLKPMELDLQKLDDKSKEISHYIAYVNTHEKIFEHIFDSVSSKITLFSFTIIGVMVVVGLFETFYLKKFLLSRKIA